MNARLKLHVLATGSKGNSSVVEDAVTGRCVVIDCGICKRDFVSRSKEGGIDLSKIDAVLVTHSHSDHTSGLGVVLRGLKKQGCQPTVFANPITVEESSSLQKLMGEGHRIEPLAADERLAIGEMSILPFSTSHDTRVSFGFRIDVEGDALGFMTDTGVVTPRAQAALENCRILALESNHDMQMLLNGPYPLWLKQRVAGKGGHLSNDQCAELLQELVWDGLEQVVAMHASQNNNTYQLALESTANALAKAGSSAVASVGLQDAYVGVC